jgi:hypothetical protein
MLKFDEWPPQPGAVTWDERATDMLRHDHRVFTDVAVGEGFALKENRLAEIAAYSGHVIIANVPGNSVETAFRIADELTKGWTENSRDLFLYQFGYGANLIRAQIDAQISILK